MQGTLSLSRHSLGADASHVQRVETEPARNKVNVRIDEPWQQQLALNILDERSLCTLLFFLFFFCFGNFF